MSLRWVTFVSFACLLQAGCPGPQEQAMKVYQDQLSQRVAQKADSDRALTDGLAAYRAGDLPKAAEYLRQAVTLDDRNSAAWMALGVAAYGQDNLFEAASAFDRASMLEPERHEPLYNLGQVLESAGKYSKAAEKYRQALKLAPCDIQVMENLARCYIRLGEDEKAAPLVEQALKSEERPDWRLWLEARAANYPTMLGDAK